jgi:hypothetical protein
LFSTVAFSQTEFIINTYQDSTQREPVIAQDANGNYVVVWSSVLQEGPDAERDLYFQLFDAADQKIGNETQVNSNTMGNQEKPAVAMASNGDFVIIWAAQIDSINQYDVYGQIFRNNQALGNNFLVNTTQTHSQTRPKVSINPDGSFIAVWDSWFQDGSDRGVYGQRFDANGTKVGLEFQINTTTTYSQARPDIAITQNGEFVVIWESWNQDIATPSGYGIFGQRFDANGIKIDGEFQINTYTNDYQWYGDILAMDAGNFVVAWCSWQQDGHDGGIYLQRFDAQANKTGPEVRVNNSTAFYQWLPQLSRVGQENFAVIWSSWKQDGHREGIYTKIFRQDGKAMTFGERVNETTQSFQWEPGVIGGNSDLEILTVWSGWGQNNNDYEIVGRRVSLDSPTGSINPNTITHLSGNSTSDFIIHVMDSMALSGDTYEISFTVPDTLPDTMKIVNLNSGQTVVSQYPFAGGSAIFYLTPTFEGVAVEAQLDFELNVDSLGSYFINNSGSNLSFQITGETDNFKNVIPIDAALIWGNTDTLPNGMYINPLDTALSIAGSFEVEVPFRAWNLTEDQPLDLWIIESGPGTSYNQRWDPAEAIRILTPPPFSTKLGDSQAEINPVLPGSSLILPDIGDSIIVLTRRPLTESDTFQFVTDPSNVVSELEKENLQVQRQFELKNNYPNPFNPTTTIPFILAQSGKIKLTIYNILGQRVITLVDGFMERGYYRVLFDASSLASGIYFYNLSQENRTITRRMLLLK